MTDRHLPPFAHTATVKDWEPLSHHLEAVGEQTRDFASVFGAGQWGWIAGRCHDLGKASVEFQQYLRTSSEARDAGEETSGVNRVNHSTFGAVYVDKLLPAPIGRMLAFCIAGHHAGLADATTVDDASARSTLAYRLDHAADLPHVEDPQLTFEVPDIPFRPARKDRAFSVAFFIRMLFSCLVDADRTCTEAFCDPAQAEERALPRPSLPELRAQLDRYLADKQQAAADTAVNRQRRSVLQQCIEAAAGRPGIYSLQVPTGGGKTLSSLAFALHHAGDRMRRVVVAIPFTSIIEQTADNYRTALGPLGERALIEHHTNVLPERCSRADQLATENWDAPLIVTTNVQLLESLFAAATTPCRKLHRLANSVLILDEAQTLPIDLLQPTLRALRELVDHYGCTVVLCTATQPALEHSEEFPIGLRVTPIIQDATPLFNAMRRVQVKHAGRLQDEVLAERLAAEPQVLCIVNTRRHAARLFEQVSAASEAGTVFHLSTLMCGAHRRSMLGIIRDRVKAKLPCRVVSTQLIEAGVDLDMPTVYRAAAGFDSIAQAAGRCNREGLAAMGTTYVFDAEEEPPAGLQREGACKAKELWSQFGDDPLAPAAVREYFRHVYWHNQHRWDKYGIMPCMKIDRGVEMQFRAIAEKYVLIRDNQLPVLIPYNNDAENLLSQLNNPFVDYVPHRKLQPYLVSVPKRVIQDMEKAGVIQAHASGVWLLLRRDAYSPEKGLAIDPIGLDSAYWGI